MLQKCVKIAIVKTFLFLNTIIINESKLINRPGEFRKSNRGWNA